MEKCSKCSTNVKSTYHYGKCPREDTPFDLKIKCWEQLDIATFPNLTRDGRLVTLKKIKVEEE